MLGINDCNFNDFTFTLVLGATFKNFVLGEDNTEEVANGGEGEESEQQGPLDDEYGGNGNGNDNENGEYLNGRLIDMLFACMRKIKTCSFEFAIFVKFRWRWRRGGRRIWRRGWIQ